VSKFLRFVSKVNSVVFHSPIDAIFIILENSKTYIKTYIKIAPTCFGPRPTIGKITSLGIMRWCGSMLPHHHIVDNDGTLPIVLT
jgi:hypothetical protein